jgi:apolipoprotein N-acyltransferase
MLNALMMALTIWLAYRVRRFSRSRVLWYISLVIFWVCFEHIHFNWDAPWPWLTLGNVFATLPDWVQWYEFTGVQGGTVWIWVFNILLYETIRTYKRSDHVLIVAQSRISSQGWKMGILFFLLIGPVAISHALKPRPGSFEKYNVVAVQPNIDPYSEKFDPLTYSTQIDRLIALSESKIDSNTRLVAWPETAIAEDIYEYQLQFYPTIRTVHAFLKRHPRVKLITGINSLTIYELNKTHSPTARLYGDKSAYYDIFNAALLLDTSSHFEIYHKSKLVPGVEKMPYPNILWFLEPFTIQMGGSSGSLGSQDSASVFRIDSSLVAAPVICYESVFGDYVGDYINKGANIITIITNDGWWHDTPGYKQHEDYAVLRAIETRRFIARAANTGISCFIYPDGTVKQETTWWTPAAIKSNIIVNNKLTFYVLHGDYIAYILKYAGYLLLIYALFGWLINRWIPKRSKTDEVSETGM